MTRVEIFSDAVIAIAITLLVLELPFEEVSHGHLADALSDHWPMFAAYAMSFLGIGIFWLHHHAIFGAVARVDRPMMLLNLLMLFAVAFLPFPTALVGDYLREGGEDARIAMGIYSATWVVLSGAAALLFSRVVHTPGLLATDVSGDAARRFLRYFQVATFVYAGFTALAALSPVAALTCYAISAVFFLWRSDYRALEKQTVETPG